MAEVSQLIVMLWLILVLLFPVYPAGIIHAFYIIIKH
jgi:uncharacterized membrane protein YqaE (UPF0057 family)